LHQPFSSASHWRRNSEVFRVASEVVASTRIVWRQRKFFLKGQTGLVHRA
jgi:hypothetical protein